MQASSSFTWLDYSEHDRRRMLDTISLFQEPDTRDELGLGAIRDAFADILFPGTGTVQTRARYLLFVPWIYLELEARHVPAVEFAAAARKAELALINPLRQSHDPEGTIGRIAGSALQRLPSNIYWLALERFGIRLCYGSRDTYHRSIATWYAAQRQALLRDGNLDDRVLRDNWHAGLPSAPRDFPKQATFVLVQAEACYLRERILSAVPGTLLAYLVAQPAAPPLVDAPWQLPDLAAFPSAIQEHVTHAHYFADIMHGAALLYNLLLAEHAEHSYRQDEYRARLLDWADSVNAQRLSLDRWDRDRFWSLATSTPTRIAPAARMFVEQWVTLVLTSTGAATVMHSAAARQLIAERERVLKGSKARLFNRSALELWSGAAGVTPLRFRWPNARQIVTDIVQGLHQDTSSA